jgi:hypothetical protein
MSYSTPAGTKFYVSSTFASAKTATNVTNANPAVVTSTSHGYVDGDIVLVTSGWEEITSMVVKVDQSDSSTFSLVGVNTSNTTLHVADGGDSSTFNLVSSWLEIPQVLTINPSGGDMKTVAVNPLARRNGFVLPDGFNPVTIGMTIGHDVSLTNWDTLLNLSRTQTLVAYKSVKPNGAVTYAYGYFIMSEVVKQQTGQADFVDASFFAQGRTISYA